MEGYRSAVELGTDFPIDITSLHSNYSKFYPQNPISDSFSPLVFLIGSTSNQYVDFSDSFIYLRLKILDANGKALTAGLYAPSFDLMSSIFSGIEVEQNSTLISSTATLYPYRSHIIKLLSYGYGTKNTVLKQELWIEDTKPDIFTTVNTGFAERMALCTNSTPFEVVGRLSESLFDQNRFVIPNITTKILLRRSLPQFCLEKGANTGDLSYEISNAVFYVRRHVLSDAVIAHHHKILSSGRTLQYPISNYNLRAFNIKSGTTSVISEPLFRGRLPSFLIITFVETEALQGSFSKQCFNFQHFSLSSISAKIDGNSSVYESMKFNFADNEYLLGYNSLKSAMNTGANHGILKDRYIAGQFLVCLSLAPNPGLFSNLQQEEGNIQVDISFGTALNKAVTCLVLGKFSSKIEIDKNYTVSVIQ